MIRKAILFGGIMVGIVSGVSAQTMQKALADKDTTAVLNLLKKGESINVVDANGSSALMTACRWADDMMVSFLLNHGATVDNPKSPKGRTPLMITCAYYGGVHICTMLIEHGANVNAAAQDGTTPLMLAAQNAKLDVVELLLKNHANPDARDAMGKKAYDYAMKAIEDEYLKKSVKDTRIDKQKVLSLLEKWK